MFACDINEYDDRGQIEGEDVTDGDRVWKHDVSNPNRLQIHSMFQMMYYILHNGRKRTPLHIMNSEAIYDHDQCKSASLITSYNHLGMCISYNKLMRFQSDMASYIVEASEESVPFPSHFNRSMFTMAAFDNFDHDEATLSGIGGSHDTVTVLFQDHGGSEEHKPRISTMPTIIHEPKSFRTELTCQNLRKFYKPSQKPDIPKDYVVSDHLPVNQDILDDFRKQDIA